MLRTQNYNNYGSLKDYFSDFEKEKVLTKAEEKELLIKYKEHGDKDSLDALVRRNQGLIVKIAKNYLPSCDSLDLMDLIIEGNLGLLTALEKFDLSKGFSLSTYATWWVRQFISRAAKTQDKTIRTPVYLQELMIKEKMAVSDFESENGVNISQDGLNQVRDELFNSNKPEKALWFNQANSVTSLQFTPFEDDESRTLGDGIEDQSVNIEEEVCEDIWKKELDKCLKSLLSKREYTVIRNRFGIGTEKKTLEQIGNSFGVTRERVRQIERKALSKLRCSKIKNFYQFA